MVICKSVPNYLLFPINDLECAAMAPCPGRVLLPFALVLAGCASTTSSIPSAWMSVPEAPEIRAIPETVLPPRPTSTGPIRVEGGRLLNAEKPVTEAFPAIDSFDYSASRAEVVFSAKRDAGFDIGLAAADGSAVNWIPNDPADEVMVEWAPRGNKISYVVRAPLGDVVRTFHVPSSFHFVADFGAATIHVLEWDEPAERFAVAYNTIDASDRVEVMRYEAKERRIAVPPAETIAADVLPFAESALVLRPFDLRYREQVPVVIWLADRFAWNDAIAALMKKARVACIVTRRAPDEELMKRVRETAWLDATRVYVVGSGRDTRPPSENAISIVGDAALPAGHYRRAGNVVSVAPAAIQSFAAGFIEDHLKRISPTNGSSSR